MVRVVPLCPFWPPTGLSDFLRKGFVRRTTSSFSFSFLGGVLLLLFSVGSSYLERQFCKSSMVLSRSLTFFFSKWISCDWSCVIRVSLHICRCWPSMFLRIDCISEVSSWRIDNMSLIGCSTGANNGTNCSRVGTHKDFITMGSQSGGIFRWVVTVPIAGSEMIKKMRTNSHMSASSGWNQCTAAQNSDESTKAKHAAA